MVVFLPMQPTLTCYSYGRFSTPEQAKGDSARRQLKDAKEWCQKNGHILSEEKFFDEGKSAYKGKHLGEEGDLRRFISLVEGGRIKAGSVLIVEEFSRLSRLPISKAVALFLHIINLGIGVVFTMTFAKRLITQAVIDNEPYILFAIVGEAQRAHEESRNKGNRIRESRLNRRASAINGEKFKIYTPPWCDWVDGEFAVNPRKRKIIKTIFERYLNGQGPTAIASVLNEDGIPAFSRGSAFNNGNEQVCEWYKQYVVRLLSDRRLIGESAALDGKENYFPRAIEPNVFNRVQARLDQRSKKSGQLGKGIVSLFAGVVTCGNCGSSVCKTRCINREGYEYFYLVCEGARSGKKSCSYHSFRYECLEQSFLFLMKYRPWFADMMQDKKDETETTEVLRGELTQTQKQIAKHYKSFEDDDNPPKILISKLKELEIKADNLRRRIEVEEGKKAERLAPQVDEQFFDALPEKLNSSPEFRLKAREVIRCMVKLTLHVHGEHPHYHVERRESGKVWTVVFLNASLKRLAFQIIKGKASKPNEGELVFDTSTLRAEGIAA